MSKPAEPNSNRQKHLAMAAIMGAATLWGSMGIFSRGLGALNISVTSVAIIRNFGAFLLMAIFFLITDRSVFRIKLRHLPIFFGTGVGSVLMMTIFYFRSQQVSSLAVAAILLYTAPTFVVILSAILFKDKITKQKLAALIIAFLGCSFVTGIWSGGLEVTPLGIALGLASGLSYSLYTVIGRFGLQHYQPFTVTFYSLLFAGVGSLFFWDTQEMATIAASPKGLLMSLGLMLFATVLPYLLYTKGLSGLGDSSKASILASVEPVVAAIVGIIAFGEPMTMGVVLGLACILTSVYILR
ncbi:MAG: EamA family transporter [Ruminiclostridium sp.]|nr:EamA family transporter [Ruminiclostridium sp.]